MQPQRKVLLTVVAVACLLLPTRADDPSQLIFEHGNKEQVLLQPDGTIHLSGGPGWLRFGHLLTDFAAVVQFRTMTPDADAGVVFRTWVGDGGWPARGYRAALSDTTHNSRDLLVGRGLKVKKLAIKAEPLWRPAGEWQTLAVNCAGAFVNLTVNGVLVATFEIGNRAGELLFDVTKGEVELRGIQVNELATASIALKQFNDDRAQYPKPVREVKPQYTTDAMQRKLQGSVLLELLVGADGSVVGTSVTRPLDPGLDRQAVIAARQWKFTPAVINDRPVPVVVTLSLMFLLK